MFAHFVSKIQKQTTIQLEKGHNKRAFLLAVCFRDPPLMHRVLHSQRKKEDNTIQTTYCFREMAQILTKVNK